MIEAIENNLPGLIAFTFFAGGITTVVLWSIYMFVKKSRQENKEMRELKKTILELEAITAKQEHTHRTKHGLEDALGEIVATEMDVSAVQAKLDIIGNIMREMRAGPREYDDTKSLSDREQEAGK